MSKEGKIVSFLKALWYWIFDPYKYRVAKKRANLFQHYKFVRWLSKSKKP